MKVDAGADLIITQLFFDVDVYMKYVQDVNDYGIKVPILPGLLPVQNYNSFKRIINLCKTTCPPELEESLEKVKNDDEKVKEVGIYHTTKMCMQLLDNGVLGLHFYTLNLEKSVSEVLRRINLTSSPKSREFPWKKNNHPKRNSENVRPIFWKNNSKSYLSKTWYWDEYPNGIWGDSRSPAFGNISEHFVSFCKDYLKDNKKSKQLKKMWGDKLTSIDDVSRTFINYIDGKINKLPWYYCS
jgi:methylenetetrahydrofolate reductase (NADPH)